MSLHDARDPRPGFDTLFNLAIDRHEAGSIAEALAMFQTLSLLKPHDMGVWQAMARCHEDLGQADVASMLLSLGEQVQEGVSS